MASDICNCGDKILNHESVVQPFIDKLTAVIKAQKLLPIQIYKCIMQIRQVCFRKYILPQQRLFCSSEVAEGQAKEEQPF